MSLRLVSLQEVFLSVRNKYCNLIHLDFFRLSFCSMIVSLQYFYFLIKCLMFAGHQFLYEFDNGAKSKE